MVGTTARAARPRLPDRELTPPPVRLGRVETAILDVLRAAGGLVFREQAMRAAFPRLLPRGRLRAGTRGYSIPAAERMRRRAVAEAALSRAIHSLEQKGLVVRDRNVRTGRTLLRGAHHAERLPAWEVIARGEEDLEAFCGDQADAWNALARDARKRALECRSARSAGPTEGARQAALEALRRQRGNGPVLGP